MLRKLIDEWLEVIEANANEETEESDVFLDFLTARMLHYLDANARFGRAKAHDDDHEEA